MGSGRGANAGKGDDERGSRRLARSREEIRVVIRDSDGQEEDAHEENTHNAPEDTLDGLGHIFTRVRRLSSRQSNHLSAAILERCKDKDLKDALDAVGKRARVVIELEANLLAADDARADEDCAQEEGQDGKDLDQRQPELRLAEGLDSEEGEGEEEAPANVRLGCEGVCKLYLPENEKPSPPRNSCVPVRQNEAKIVWARALAPEN